MGRTEKNVVCRDLAGIERFVAAGSDIPKGWTVVRDSDSTLLAADADQPRRVANMDAARDRADRIAEDAKRAQAATSSGDSDPKAAAKKAAPAK